MQLPYFPVWFLGKSVTVALFPPTQYPELEFTDQFERVADVISITMKQQSPVINHPFKDDLSPRHCILCTGDLQHKFAKVRAYHIMAGCEDS